MNCEFDVCVIVIGGGIGVGIFVLMDNIIDIVMVLCFIKFSEKMKVKVVKWDIDEVIVVYDVLVVVVYLFNLVKKFICW